MQYIVSAPSTLRASIQLPASKSISNRALILHSLAQSNIVPCNLSDCDDTRVMIRALNETSEQIDILAAGTAMRFLTAYLSVTPGTRTITGTKRMQQRPIRILVDALRKLGAQIEYAANEGFPPLRITGTELKGEEISLAGNISSQYISALLMIGAMLPKGLRLHLTGDIISRPYINLTLQLMRDFGAKAEWTSENSITVHPGGYQEVPFTVESDWSAASYWYQMVALQGIKNKKIEKQEKGSFNTSTYPEIELLGLFSHSYQGDSRGAEVFSKLGVRTEYTDHGVKLTSIGVPVARLVEDFVDIPDLAQTFVVTCCLMNIPFRFTGLQSLKIKETDRIIALITELRKLGYVIRSEQDSILSWDGERCPAEAEPVISTYEDHRMAMAFAPACLILPQIQIDEPQVVSKSYPSYWESLQEAGFKVSLKPKKI
ncbi:3-phosphoshikimate 1-carboxyvinyltransferase [uncultured Bacteroides sp.]|uniref:3-phosphoshikimate 1-carboxyvinyltransferase n=1 Tax=uncultured Bacteroides sp. TaxID=162156 RepID=UPI002622AFB8|nr:3-phosphoshikimate 1-carboxyvinyltransferase [uncultured Bacteroides sp.]